MVSMACISGRCGRRERAERIGSHRRRSGSLRCLRRAVARRGTPRSSTTTGTREDVLPRLSFEASYAGFDAAAKAFTSLYSAWSTYQNSVNASGAEDLNVALRNSTSLSETLTHELTSLDGNMQQLRKELSDAEVAAERQQQQDLELQLKDFEKILPSLLGYENATSRTSCHPLHSSASWRSSLTKRPMRKWSASRAGRWRSLSSIMRPRLAMTANCRSTRSTSTAVI